MTLFDYHCNEDWLSLIINHRDLNDDGSLYDGDADDRKDKLVNEELGKDDFEMGKINMRTLTDKHEDDNNDRSAVGCDWRIGYHLLSTIRI